MARSWTLGGAGAGHGIDVERLFDHVGGVGGTVLGDPVFDAADAVIRRGGRGDDILEGREIVGERPRKIIGAGGGRTVIDGIGGGEGDSGRSKTRRAWGCAAANGEGDWGGGEGKHRGLGNGNAADTESNALGDCIEGGIIRLKTSTMEIFD